MLLTGINQASATCICNDSDWDYSGSDTQATCGLMCESHGGVKTWAAPTCNFCCCNSGGSVKSGTPTDCATFCKGSDGVQFENAAMTCDSTPTCNATSLPLDEFAPPCEIDPDEGTCVGSANTDNTTPSGGKAGTRDTKPKTAGPPASMPNFSGIRSVQDLFAKIVAFIMPLALLFAGVMIIWSGFLFVTAQGNETAISTAKKNFIWTITGVAIVLASGAIVDYISGLLGGGSTGTGEALKTKIETILRDQIIPLMFLLVTIYFFWGVITYVRAAGEEKAIETGKTHMIWGIIGMAVMASAWGIVEMIRVSVQ